MARLVLMAGMPGAGKTTVARRLADALPAVRLCPDEWLLDLALDPHDSALRLAMEARLCTHAYELLRAGTAVVLELGSWTRAERDQLRDAARDVGADVSLVCLDVPLEERWRRLVARAGQLGSVPVTREQLESWQRWWEPATAAELATYDELPVTW